MITQDAHTEMTTTLLPRSSNYLPVNAYTESQLLPLPTWLRSVGGQFLVQTCRSAQKLPITWLGAPPQSRQSALLAWRQHQEQASLTKALHSWEAFSGGAASNQMGPKTVNTVILRVENESK